MNVLVPALYDNEKSARLRAIIIAGSSSIGTLDPPVASSNVNENVAFSPYAVGEGGTTERTVSRGRILTDMTSKRLV